MLPIIDKPLIEYAVEEAVDAGIEEIIFVTSHTKIAMKITLILILNLKRSFRIAVKRILYH